MKEERNRRTEIIAKKRERQCVVSWKGSSRKRDEREKLIRGSSGLFLSLWEEGCRSAFRHTCVVDGTHPHCTTIRQPDAVTETRTRCVRVCVYNTCVYNFHILRFLISLDTLFKYICLIMNEAYRSLLIKLKFLLKKKEKPTLDISKLILRNNIRAQNT